MSIVAKLLLFIMSTAIKGAWAASFTLVNDCEYTVWPGFLSNAGTAALQTTGFELPQGTTQLVETPARWSGRLWGRTGCTFDPQGKGNCTTGDCGGQLQCGGAGAAPPASLAEFTLDPAGLDFYDVSLVDGYNLPVLVAPIGGTGECSSIGCVADINRSCPKELQLNDGAGDGAVLACKSACEAFGSPEYCCSGPYANPDTCKPSAYSQLFKAACPRAYSYAFDDKSSTFTCKGAHYTVTFCATVATASAEKLNTPPVATSDGDGDGNGNSTAVGESASISMASGTWVPTWRPLLMGLLFILNSAMMNI